MFAARVWVGPEPLPEETIRQLYAAKKSLSEIARQTGISRWVVRRVLGLRKS